MRKQRFWYAAAAATVLLAAGCNGGADNQPSPTPTPTVSSPTASPSDSGSPSPSASVSIPAEAMAQTPEGAVAFVKFFFDSVNEAWQQGDPDGLSPLFSGTCGTCANNAQYAVDLKAAGQRTNGPSVEVSDLVAHSSDGSSMFVDFTLHQLQVSVVDGSEQIVSTSVPSTTPLRAAVRWEEGRWFVGAIGKQQ